MANIQQDIQTMHRHFKVYDAVGKLTPEQMKKFLRFRLRMLTEEYHETIDAYHEDNPEEIVDGLIDLIVIAVGTLDLFQVDFDQAWEQVFQANITKQVGVKAQRPNPLGLPDLVKPEGWRAPNHEDNIGWL